MMVQNTVDNTIWEKWQRLRSPDHFSHVDLMNQYSFWKLKQGSPFHHTSLFMTKQSSEVLLEGTLPFHVNLLFYASK
jgi:hypothetical protein